MTDYSLLERTLAANLSWNAARIKFLARFLLALFAARTVNLAQIATFFVGRATTDSNYKRIKRFLRFCSISEPEVARLVIRLMRLEPPFVITIDRTEWQLGKTWVNVLMLAIVSPEGVAVPAAEDGVFKERLLIGRGATNDIREILVNFRRREYQICNG